MSQNANNTTKYILPNKSFVNNIFITNHQQSILTGLL